MRTRMGESVRLRKHKRTKLFAQPMRLDHVPREGALAFGRGVRVITHSGIHDASPHRRASAQCANRNVAADGASRRHD